MSSSKLAIESYGFAFGAPLPDEYAQSGGNTIPPLTWTGVPADTSQLVLIVHDPDAPRPYGWTHWLLYNIDPETTSLAEVLESQSYVSGKNDYGTTEYMGPNPPVGDLPHAYYFHLLAIAEPIKLDPGLDRQELLALIGDRCHAVARHMGTFQRLG